MRDEEIEAAIAERLAAADFADSERAAAGHRRSTFSLDEAGHLDVRRPDGTSWVAGNGPDSLQIPYRERLGAVGNGG